MIRIQQLKLPITHTHSDLEQAVQKSLKVKNDNIISMEIIKRSIDARKKPMIEFVYTIDIKVLHEEKLLKRIQNHNILKIEKTPYTAPACGNIKLEHRPVIVGTGPAGLFCGWLLAKQGYRPILLERGESVDERRQKVNRFWKSGILDTDSNVQFGEGGAGTFSDGKLNTSVKDPGGRGRLVLETFVSAGASEEILYLNKPHIGTDILQQAVKNIRRQIIEYGGDVRFSSQMTDILFEKQTLRGIVINQQEVLECGVMILAIGNSARDTLEMLVQKGIHMTSKPFAVGLRIEHPQSMINEAQYGIAKSSILPAADYKLTRKLPNGRGLYSFCMCPGGYVVNASSEHGRTAVNGMSYQARNGPNANSAMVVTVTSKDFDSEDILAGMHFQRKLEEAAYAAGNGNVPVQLLGDFCQGVKSSSPGEILPCIKGRYTMTDLRSCFPKTLEDTLRKGILECGQLIRGFDRPDAVLSGVESRTSSPVHIMRDEQLVGNISGIYPCGEGAGYAGGITSASMDGIKAAEAVIRKYARP